MQKLVYTTMQDWEIKEKQQKQQWCNWKLKTYDTKPKM